MGIGAYMRMTKDQNAKKIVTENKTTPKKYSSTKDKKVKDIKIGTFDYGIEEKEKNVVNLKEKNDKTEENFTKEKETSDKEEEQNKSEAEPSKETLKVESSKDETNNNDDEKLIKGGFTMEKDTKKQITENKTTEEEVEEEEGNEKNEANSKPKINKESDKEESEDEEVEEVDEITKRTIDEELEMEEEIIREEKKKIERHKIEQRKKDEILEEWYFDNEEIEPPQEKWYCGMERFAYEEECTAYSQKDITGQWHGSIPQLVRKAIEENNENEEGYENVTVTDWIIFFCTRHKKEKEILTLQKC